MINKHLAKIVGQETTPADATQCTFTNQNGRGRRLASCHPEAAESLASPGTRKEGSVHSALSNCPRQNLSRGRQQQSDVLSPKPASPTPPGTLDSQAGATDFAMNRQALSRLTIHLLASAIVAAALTSPA